MKTLILYVGLPRSGKSTASMLTGYPVVNPDSIRLAMHGQAYIPEAEVLVWPIALMMVRALFNAGHNAVVVDATNTTKERRRFWKSAAWEIIPMVFDASPAVCIERAKATGREDLIPVILSMALKFEPVEEDEFE